MHVERKSVGLMIQQASSGAANPTNMPIPPVPTPKRELVAFVIRFIF